MFNYGSLKLYIEKYNQICLKKYITDDGLQLGNWVARQRRIYSKKIISKERILLLERLPLWTWNVKELLWKQGYNYLKVYLDKHHSICKRDYITNNGFHLGNWVGVQRKNFNINKLSKDRISQLELLSTWEWDIIEARWQNCYDNIKKYIIENNTICSTHYITDDGLHLGSWLSVQRINFRKAKLSNEKIDLLELLPNWEWNILQAPWHEGYDHLKSYIEENDQICVKSYITDNGFALGSWVKNQIKNYNRNGLTKENINLLEKLPNWSWDRNSSKWQEGYNFLKSFMKKNNSVCTEGYITENGFKLGNWLSTQRAMQNKNKLSNERKILLERLPYIIFDRKDLLWQERYNDLKDYINKNNSICTNLYVADDGYNLGRWLVFQRQSYRKGNISKNKIGLLELLPFWTWDPDETSWQDSYNELKKHISEHNFVCREDHITESGLNLGRWVRHQKTRFKKNKLSKDKISLLEEFSSWKWQ